MNLLIKPGEEDKIKKLKPKDKVQYICLDCKKLCTIGKYNWHNFYCRACSTKRTSLEKYGVDNPAKSEKCKSKQSKTKALKTDEEKEAILKKYKDTCLERYGVDNVSKNEDIHNRSVETSTRRYGGVGFSSEVLKDKAEQTSLNLYNKSLHAASEEGHIQSSLEKFGVMYPMQNAKIREKAELTNLEKYGQKHPSSAKYVYNNIKFDSSWELYYFLYLKDNKIPFEFHPNKSFKYVYNGEQHDYYPDFYVENEYVELKGPQFFTENNLMQNPFDHTLDGLFEAKHQCMIQNNIKVIRDISDYKNYIDSKYTKNFILLFKSNLEFPYPNRDLKDKSSMGIIRHFHKSIYMASKYSQVSPLDAWNSKKDFEKVAKNRLKYVGHCTPEDILTGYNVLRINSKVSVFSPNLAENLIREFLGEGTKIFDPFSGFSGRMLGAVNCKCYYKGQDINKDHVDESNDIIKYLNISDVCSVKQQDIIQDVYMNLMDYNLFTCPPYSNKEFWTSDKSEVIKTCDEWVDLCLQKYKCKHYLFVVDTTLKYSDKIVKTIKNTSHFEKNEELVLFF